MVAKNLPLFIITFHFIFNPYCLTNMKHSKRHHLHSGVGFQGVIKLGFSSQILLSHLFFLRYITWNGHTSKEALPFSVW